MSVKNWKSFYKIEEGRSTKENIVDTISLWSAIGLLWYAAVSIIREHFPDYIQTMRLADFSEVGTALPGSNLVEVKLEWGLILLLILLLWAGGDWPKKYLKHWSLLLYGAALGVLGHFFFSNTEQLFAGATAIAQEYLKYWNVYYGSSIFIGSGDMAYAPKAFSALLMVVWMLIWGISYGAKKRILLGIFPIVMLASELVVGLSPTGDGLFCVLFGCMLLINADGKAISRKVAVVAGAAVCLLVCNLGFGEQIAYLTTPEKKQEVLEWQKSFTITDLLKGFSVDFHFSKEALGNESPVYTGKVLLEMEAKAKPQGAIYLKGFYGTTYKNGTWTYDDSAFQSICSKYNCSQEELAEELVRMPYETVLKGLKEGHIFDEDNQVFVSAVRVMDDNVYEINYVGTTGDVAYIPYYAAYDSLDEEYDFLGDFLLKKRIADKRIEVDAVSNVVNNSVLKEAGALAPLTEKSQILNELAAEYTKTDRSLAFLDDAKEYVSTYMIYDGWYEVEEGTVATNSLRLGYAKTIKNYLGIKMSYSLILDDLPMGADPVDYAVMEGHEGYCMHFASAGALLLREFGVPARYVSGYVVLPSDFEPTEGRYLAEVTDYAAHAWVEIYLDNVGWVPFEMTPGYNNATDIPTEGDAQAYEEISEDRREQIEEMESEDEADDTEQANSQGETLQEESQSGETQKEEDTERGDLQQEDSDGDESSGDSSITEEEHNKDEVKFKLDKGFVKIIGAAGIIAGLLFLGYQGLKKYFFRYEHVLDKEVSKEQTRRAVKRINKRMYHMLRARTAKKLGKSFKKGYWTDARMEEELIAQFDCVTREEWTLYMDIVKKMHYSMEDISKEEMLHCYNCYKKVWELTIRKQISDMIQRKYKK